MEIEPKEYIDSYCKRFEEALQNKSSKEDVEKLRNELAKWILEEYKNFSNNSIKHSATWLSIIGVLCIIYGFAVKGMFEMLDSKYNTRLEKIEANIVLIRADNMKNIAPERKK